MEIMSVSVYQHDLPIVGGPYVMSSGPLYALDTTLVRIETAAGQVGWGETCPLGPTYAPAHAEGARAALSVLGPAVVGKDISRPRVVRRAMDEALNGHAYAKAAIDIAVHDALGKELGRSLADLMGGQMQGDVPSYCALNVGDPAETARLALERVGEGYRRIQMKVGGRSLDQDIEAARAVARAIDGRARLVLDGNRSLSTAEALALSAALADLTLKLEQPCETWAACRSLIGRLNHPLVLDESADNLAVIAEMIGSGGVDGFGIKLTRMGGPQAMVAVRDLCEAAQMPHTCDDSWGGDIIAAACIHLGSTVDPRLLEGVWTALPYVEKRYDPALNLRPIDGRLRVPSGPGLGLDLDREMFGSPVARF